MPREFPRLEIVGVAGTGKSTLAALLLEQHPHWRLADSVHARAPRHWIFFLRAAPGIVRLVADAVGRLSWVRWGEIKLYVHASEWHRFLQRPDERSHVMVLDQGPLFALACLVWDHRAEERSTWFGTWTRDTAKRWAEELDVIAVLDAPDATLLERINTRDKRHALKGRPTAEASGVLATHRRAYEEVLGDIDGTGQPKLLRFDTAARTLESIAEELSEALVPDHRPVALDRALDANAQLERRAVHAGAGDR